MSANQILFGVSISMEDYKALKLQYLIMISLNLKRRRVLIWHSNHGTDMVRNVIVCVITFFSVLVLHCLQKHQTWIVGCFTSCYRVRTKFLFEIIQDISHLEFMFFSRYVFRIRPIIYDVLGTPCIFSVVVLNFQTLSHCYEWPAYWVYWWE